MIPSHRGGVVRRQLVVGCAGLRAWGRAPPAGSASRRRGDPPFLPPRTIPLGGPAALSRIYLIWSNTLSLNASSRATSSS